MSASTGQETTVIETAKPFSYTAELHLSDELSDPQQRQQFMRQDSSGDAENWRLRDVTLFPALGLVFKDHLIVESSRYCVTAEEEAAARTRLEVACPRLQAGHCFLGLNRYCRNYFHLLIQVIPAIAGYAAFPSFQEGILLLPRQWPVFFRGLELAGITLPKIELIDAEVPLTVTDLTFSSYLSHANLISVFRRTVFDRMIETARRRHTAKQPPSRIVYVWRADATKRVMRNEDALVERLIKRFDVQPQVLSSLTLDDQIMLFQDARIVIGAHGAGLANIVFCRPATVLYELIPHHYINSAINKLAQLRGMHYWCDVHKAEPRPGLWRHQTPWSVDIDAVERRLNEILVRYDL